MWRALRRSPRPSMCRSSSCEPPFDTAPSARAIRPPRRNSSSPSHAAIAAPAVITPERVIVFQTNGAPQRVASARLAPLPAGQTPALFDEPDPHAPREDQPARLPGGHAGGGSWLVELASLGPDDGAERFLFERKWRALRSLGARA